MKKYRVVYTDDNKNIKEEIVEAENMYELVKSFISRKITSVSEILS